MSNRNCSPRRAVWKIEDGPAVRGRCGLFGRESVRPAGLRVEFTDDELREAVVFAHGLGRKVYVTVNIFAHNADLTGLPDYLRGLEACGVDALLISDLGIWSLAREVVPHMPLHVSTQANTTNYASVLAWERLGASRVVLARELSLAEIAEIGSRTSVELEAFVHGAMCISYSGRCWLSNYLTGRDGNRGACAQICRWEFGLTHKEHPGEVFEAAEDEHGTYILNSKDLCLLPYLPDLMKAGVASFKIEGRMKSAHYAASVVSVYRRAIDACWNNPDHYEIRPEWTDELEKVSHRPYTTAFAVQQPDGSAQEYGTSQYLQTEEFTGLVRGWQDGRLTVEQRNKMSQGERLEVFRPDGSLAVLVLEDLRDAEGRPMDSAPHAQQIFTCTCADPLPPYTLLRRKIRNIQE